MAEGVRRLDRLRYLLAGLPPRGDVVSPIVPDDRYRTVLAIYYAFLHWLPVGSALDLGCGTGAGSALLAGKAAEVSGVDGDRRLVRFARRRFGGSTLRFRQLDPVPVPSPQALPESPFDAVVALEALRRAPDVERAIAELAALLQPEGMLCSAVAPIGLPEGLEAARVADPTGNHFYAWYWQGLLESAFEEVRLVRLLPPPGSYPDFASRAPSKLAAEEFVAEEIEAEELRRGPALSLLLVAKRPK